MIKIASEFDIVTIKAIELLKMLDEATVIDRQKVDLTRPKGRQLGSARDSPASGSALAGCGVGA
jgi:hypothetical protein